MKGKRIGVGRVGVSKPSASSHMGSVGQGEPIAASDPCICLTDEQRSRWPFSSQLSGVRSVGQSEIPSDPTRGKIAELAGGSRRSDADTPLADPCSLRLW